VPTAEERSRAEQLATESINPLQAGDAATGRGLVEQALALDPNNELARLLMRQLTADPVAELGSVNFAYTIQRDDTLARLAQRFLGDRHLFYILARYNDIAQPNRIQVGQVIRIPGKAPPRAAEPAAAEPPKPAQPAPAPTVPPAPVDDGSAARLADGRERERKGDLEGALAAYMEILRRDPAHAEAKQRSAAVRKRLADRYYAEGTAAFARQDLDKSIAAWERVLELDPEHQNARLKRQQAIDLKERLKRFDGKK
jgi:tetratricopeptide (TPR) repeat protein